MNPAVASSPPLAPDTLDDPALLGLALRGESAAFATLFARHYPAIHAFAYRLHLCPAEADDIAQETFVQAARSLASFRGEASFKNWLYTIATNKSRDRHRQHVRRSRLGEELATLADTEAPASLPAHAGDTSAAHADVRHALAALAPELREAVALVYYEGLNHAEAARILGCAESTVSWRVFRAKHKLKKALRPHAASPRHD
ncbi:MAG: RNA polymerase sigma factor [Burkholderiales bacterium]|nr:RNA polymerase sigma factor [Opitutaceae bacterium]